MIRARTSHHAPRATAPGETCRPGAARRRLAAAVLALAASTTAAGAAPIKLATLVPDGSVWDKALRGMGSEWRQATDGRVSLRLYPGGVAGDEPDVLRKMRIGQLDAAVITVAGLSDLDPAFNVLNIPLFFDSYPELFWVIERLEPLLVERLRAKGFELVSWGHAGWVHLFSSQPLEKVDDLKSLKIFVWAGDDEMTQWWKTNGFRPVPLAATDIMTGLQTGMIEVLPSTPLAALTLQWFRQTPYMHGLGLAPLVGATVFTRRAWERIDEADRPLLVDAARRLEERLEAEIPGQDESAIREMSKRGLTVIDDYDEAPWREAAETFAETMAELRVPREIYERALAERRAYRERAAAGGGD